MHCVRIKQVQLSIFRGCLRVDISSDPFRLDRAIPST
jgi:hypothetical protein